ncbi:hypothetical protein KEM56_001077, partial [Ascosphaera pollenicola]
MDGTADIRLPGLHPLPNDRVIPPGSKQLPFKPAPKKDQPPAEQHQLPAEQHQHSTESEVQPLQEKYYMPDVPIPSGNNEMFKDTAFFRKFDVEDLPQPCEIRKLRKRKIYPPVHEYARFPSLGLIVKYGTWVQILEGQNMWLLDKVFNDGSVPEVYGWRTYGDEVYIYMELIDGVPLSTIWDKLYKHEKRSLARELQEMFERLRRLQQPPTESGVPFIGTITRDPLRQGYLSGYALPVFEGVKAFNDYFCHDARVPEEAAQAAMLCIKND